MARVAGGKKTKDIGRACEFCKFASFGEAVLGSLVIGDMGYCKRYPPKESDIRYPRVCRGDWCGEWKAK
jgi:hypothetical protein